MLDLVRFLKDCKAIIISGTDKAEVVFRPLKLSFLNKNGKNEVLAGYQGLVMAHYPHSQILILLYPFKRL
jgi:hypothetical protein